MERPPSGGFFVWGRGKEESASFWKKKQKLLHVGVRVGFNAYPNEQKFFGSFFQKRTACLLV
jgi:hypothetical protein